MKKPPIQNNFPRSEGVALDGFYLTLTLYHTVKDWMLRFASLQIDEPSIQTYQLTVPGRDGILDLTDALYVNFHDSGTNKA